MRAERPVTDRIQLGDQKTKKLCLAEVRTKYISEADFVSALAANRDVPLRVVVSLSS